MAYMNQSKKAIIAKNLKPILAKYGMKGSLSVRNHSTIVLTLQSGKVDFIGDLNSERLTWNGQPTIDKDTLRKKYNLDINTYWYQEHYNGDSYFFIQEALNALRSADWYDKTDAQIDYVDTAYYIDVNVGKWNKPYTVTP